MQQVSPANQRLPGASGPPTYRPPLRERLIAPIRKYGVRSFLVAVSGVGVAASLLSASGETLPLWMYSLVTLAAWAAVVLAFTFSQPRYKFWLFSLLYGRRAVRDDAKRPYFLNIYGATPDAPVMQVAAGRRIDRVYEGGLRCLLGAQNPVAIIASPARDVSRAGARDLPAGMFSKGGSRTECVVDPGVFGIPLKPYVFERELQSTEVDVEHSLAVRDIVYLPHLAHALSHTEARWSKTAEPFIWPQHCIDIPFITNHDVVVVGGADSNFWHAALFEPLFRSFHEPPSTVPLALDLRDFSSEVSTYSSRTINVRLARREVIPGLEDARRFELDERRFPTCGMILACENPFSLAVGKRHWCVFVAGTRSLGTSGAVLALAAMVEQMQADERVNYFSVVETEEPGVYARVSAILCRVVEAEYAAEAPQGRIRHRGRADIPTDRSDPNYRDSYIPTCVEYLDNTGETPEWRPLVRLGERDAGRAPERAKETVAAS